MSRSDRISEQIYDKIYGNPTPEDILAAEIAGRRGITIEQAEAIIRAAEPLWDALEPLVDSYGGSEFQRILPDVIDAIHRLANPLAYDA